MDDPRLDAEVAGQPVQGPHWRPPQLGEVPEAIALRLILQPSGLVVDCYGPSVLLGRHSTADVRLPLPDVSRRHCRLVCADGLWQIFDLNSLNGIFVNGEKVQQAILRDRDQVRIGGFTFEVDLRPGIQVARLADQAQPAGDMMRSIAQALPENRRAS